MASVDVLTDVIINRPAPAVSAYAADPSNAPAWYVNIESAQWKTPPPLRTGAQIAFAAHFLGRRLEYTYQVTEFVPGERLVMRTAQGPFPMETTYTWAPADGGAAQLPGDGCQGFRDAAGGEQRKVGPDAFRGGAQPVRGDRDHRADPAGAGQVDADAGAQGVAGDVVVVDPEIVQGVLDRGGQVAGGGWLVRGQRR